MDLSSLKTAIVHDWLNGMRGGERVLEQALPLFPHAPVYTLHCDPGRISAKIREHEIRTSMIQYFPLRKRAYRFYLPLYPLAVRGFDFSGFDLVLSFSHCAVKNVRVPPGTPHLCYCFSPMRYVWTLADQYFGTALFRRALLSPVLKRLREWDRRGAGRVTRFLAVSRTVKERIERYYGLPSRVVYPPVEIPFEPSSSKKEYFLVLSALTPYKRVDLAVRACLRKKVPLKIAGTGPELARLRKMASCGEVEFLGWVSETEKKELLRHARALLFPGLEDFGIVPLEAMAFATPVVGYGRGGLTETVEDGKTGVLFENQSVEDLSRALDRLENMRFDTGDFERTVGRFSPRRFREELGRAVREAVDSL
jgi:glycosyltransferase involved in cell wall biosynthesis